MQHANSWAEAVGNLFVSNAVSLHARNLACEPHRLLRCNQLGLNLCKAGRTCLLSMLCLRIFKPNRGRKGMLAGFRKGNAGRLIRMHSSFYFSKRLAWPYADCLLAVVLMLSSLQSNPRQSNFAGKASPKIRNV
jgi:hypothetical protein